MRIAGVTLSLAAMMWTLALSGAVAAEQQTGDTTVHEKVTTTRETTTMVRKKKVEQTKATRLVAIFLKNRAGASFDKKLGAFEDLLVGNITDMGFRVMSRHDTVKAVRSFLATPVDKGHPGVPGVPGSKLDEALDNNTSALRLAQNMGADYLMIVSVTTAGSQSQHLKRPDLGINRKVTTYNLRSTYKILDASIGDSISAGNVLATKRVQQSTSLEEQADVVNDLLADAAAQIAGKLQAKGGAAAVAKSRKADSMVQFTVTCSMQDLTVPEVVKDEKGNYTLTGSRYKLEAMAVTVELDGVVIGTAPGKMQALPGLHKIRLSREGFKDWERTINVRDGQQLNVALTLSDKGRANWMLMSKFFSNLKRDALLTDANAELIRGYAQMMRQSGWRVDRKVDIKVNTTDAPSVHQTNVARQNVAQSVWP